MQSNESSIPLEKLAAFVDDELDDHDKETLKQQLAEDEALQHVLDAQLQIKEVVNRSTGLEKAPVHLRARIRRQLDEIERVPGFLEQLADVFKMHTAKSLFATAVLLAVVLFPWVSSGISPVASQSNIITAKFQVVQGKIICIDCDQLHAANIENVQHTDLHRAGLKTSDGLIWEFLDTGKGSELLHDFSRASHSYEIEGYVFSDNRVLNVTSYKLL